MRREVKYTGIFLSREILRMHPPFPIKASRKRSEPIKKEKLSGLFLIKFPAIQKHMLKIGTCMDCKGKEN